MSKRWPRDQSAPHLPRPSPKGCRPPNGIKWAHSKDEFCTIKCYHDDCVHTWSRSMLKEFGEGYTPDREAAFFSHPKLLNPRRRRPWPVLKFPPQEQPRLGAEHGIIDEGSDHEDDQSWEAVVGDSDDPPIDTTTLPPRLSALQNPPPWRDHVSGQRIVESQKTQLVVTFPSKRVPEPDIDTLVIPEVVSLLAQLPFYEKFSLETSPHNFSLDGIPDLEEHIPVEYLPHYLKVHDQGNLTSGNQNTSYGPHPDTVVWTYQRVYPAPTDIDTSDTARVAHLYLSPGHKIGTGHHSIAYHSPLRLPSPLTTFKSSSSRPGTVGVVAKLAMPVSSARELLDNEAEIYNSFPKHFSEGYCGYHHLYPHLSSPTSAGPIAPKFFGWYLPVYSKDEKRPRFSWEKRSPILLMENCGQQICASILSTNEKRECYSLLLRFHNDKGFIHNSVFERNIVVKSGPLTVPPDQRSRKSPIFRLIDFGRSISYKTCYRNALEEQGHGYAEATADRRFDRWTTTERRYGKEELNM